MALNISKFLVKFAEEASEHCSQLESGLLSLESESNLSATIDTIFRSAHTIKGTAKMLKLGPIAEVAHRMEDVLDDLRKDKLSFSKELSDLLLEGVDAIRALVAEVAASKPLIDVLPSICEKLELAVSVNKEPEIATETADTELMVVRSETLPDNRSLSGTDNNKDEKNAKSETASISDIVRIRGDKLDDLIKLMGEMIGQNYRKRQRIVELSDIVRLSAQNMNLLKMINEADTEDCKELALGTLALHNQLIQLQGSLRDDTAREDHLTSELQEHSLKMRMVPLSTIFDVFHRSVRDLARETGKEVDLKIDGGDTELDRKMIDQIGDSLLHMIRNAIDHGIETPDVRTLVGKNKHGTIYLRAYYDSGGVSIILQDDGAGISLDKIKEIALKRQVVSETTITKMTEREVMELIFMPGFSTSPIITDLSGRGVGMDVVRKSIVDHLKGSIQINTRTGKGTTFFLKVPVTLALSRMLLVSAGNHRFALPVQFIQEVLSIQSVEIVNVINKRAVRLREQIIPVEELQSLLRCPGAASHQQKEMLIVIVYSGIEKLGLIVDAILDEADMVIKPLPISLKELRLASGVIIDSNNAIVSVLNIGSLIKTAREVRPDPVSIMTTAQEKKQKKILVVDDSINTSELEKSILEAYGYSVDLADNGMAALEKINQRMYDAIITDVEMPHLDGFSLTMRLRQDERYREVPIIIVTSRARDEDKRRGIQLGANAYIVKGSFDQNNLIETVQNLIG
ncbi:response regulator [Pelosinus sp. sgz500959]|uniref:hybrid sensor histidine kinase/response regulator n=1 Tax=Pelosinus sp. sgz500959 TaxID=3242472 RepID=UPI00366B83B0